MLEYSTLWEWFQDTQNKTHLMKRFKKINGVRHLRPWQKAFLNRDLEDQTSCILQLPPGAGKTFLAQWIALESLMLNPRHRILFAVPLRVLAVQLCRDIQNIVDILNESLKDTQLARVFKVQLVEGPGSNMNIITNNIIVATYEHAAGELRKDPEDAKTTKGAYRWIGTVIIDEIHNVAKGDRGMVIDDILYFSKLRKLTNPNKDIKLVGLSGTLEDWVVTRLLDSYNCLFEHVYNTENLQIDTTPRPKAARLFLDSSKFQVGTLLMLVRDIVKSLAYQRLTQPPESWQRLVVFMSSVIEAELAFMFMSTDPELLDILTQISKTQAYATPKIKLVNTLEDLQERFCKYKVGNLQIDKRFRQEETSKKLEAGGVYIHHAQLGGQRQTETQLGWSDEIQDQLATKDFIAVFSTSTLSVGINLNSTQIGVLGPNTMWTIDQAEQMIGRVGRSDKDVERSYVLVVDSPIYSAPGISSVMVPTGWFVPRLAAAVTFINNYNIKSQNKPRRYPLIDTNLDIRGFFRPYNTATLELPDVPGNGVIKTAKNWGVLEEGDISTTARAALNLCKQDLKSLPTTIKLVSLARLGPVPWTLTLLWTILVCRLPTCWTKVKDCKSDSHVLAHASFHAGIFNDSEAESAYELIKLYGDAHEQFKGDTSLPGSSTFEKVLVFFKYFVYSIGLFPDNWITKDPADLIEYAFSIFGFLNTLIEDITPLYNTSSVLDFDIKNVICSIKECLDFLALCIDYNPSTHLLPIEIIQNFQSGASFTKIPEITEERRTAFIKAIESAYADLGLPPPG